MFLSIEAPVNRNFPFLGSSCFGLKDIRSHLHQSHIPVSHHRAKPPSVLQTLCADVVLVPKLHHSRLNVFCLSRIFLPSGLSSHIPVQHDVATGSAAAARARGKVAPQHTLALYIWGKTKLFREDGL